MTEVRSAEHFHCLIQIEYNCKQQWNGVFFLVNEMSTHYDTFETWLIALAEIATLAKSSSLCLDIADMKFK